VTVPTEQERVTRRYDRLASLYDFYNSPMEWAGLTRRRRRVVSRAHGRVLEAGVGTGRNLEFYGNDVDLTAPLRAWPWLRSGERGSGVRSRHDPLERWLPISATTGG